MRYKMEKKRIFICSHCCFFWHDEQEQTFNQILSEMDGFDPTTAVMVMAACNRP